MFQYSSEQMNFVVVIYECVDTVRGHDPEGRDTKRDLDTDPHTGRDTAWIRCYRVTAVCLLVLCVLLLTAITLLWIKFNNQTNQLQTRYNTLTIERDQLQKYRDALSKLGEDSGWTYFSSSLYYISTVNKTWNESRDYCRQKGADLVIINSIEEQVFIDKLLNKRKTWIGLNDIHTEGEWKWVDGTSLTTEEFWRAGEPNGETNENCVLADHSVKNWADYPCTAKFICICEKNL